MNAFCSAACDSDSEAWEQRFNEYLVPLREGCQGENFTCFDDYLFEDWFCEDGDDLCSAVIH